MYGSGVTAVSDPAGVGTYIVTFDRDMAGCVVHAVSGFGDPAGGGSADWAIPMVTVYSGGPEHVGVTFRDHADATVDSAFMITAFC